MTLDKVKNPEGRVDVLVFRLMEQVAKGIESKHGIPFWDEAKPFVSQLVSDNLPVRKLKKGDLEVVGKIGRKLLNVG